MVIPLMTMEDDHYMMQLCEYLLFVCVLIRYIHIALCCSTASSPNLAYFCTVEYVLSGAYEPPEGWRRSVQLRCYSTV